MGLAANYPIALAPLMGENAFFATVVLAGVAGVQVSWQVALAAVFVSGVLFLHRHPGRDRRPGFQLTLFFSPIAAAVASPIEVDGRLFSPFTAPALILVGCSSWLGTCSCST